MSREPQNEFRQKMRTLLPYLVTGCILIAFAVILFSIASDSELKGISTILKVLKSTLIGLILAFFLSPAATSIENALFRLQDWFRKKRHRTDPSLKSHKKQFVGLSILICYVIFLGLLAIAFIYVIPQLLRSLNNIILLVSETISWLSQRLNTISDNWEDTALAAYIDINAVTNIINGTLNDFNADLQSYLTGMLPKVYGFVINIASSLLNFIVGIVISVYLMADRRRLIGTFKKVIYALFNKDHARIILNLGAEAVHIFKYFFLGKIIDSLIIGILCAALMWILDLDYLLLISCIVGVTNIIPYFGPWVGAILSILILLMDQPVQGLIGGIMIIALQQLDGNLIGPYILGGTLGIRPFWILFSVTVGGGLFGVVGMIFGVPLFTVIYTFSEHYVRYRLRQKELSFKEIDDLEAERQAQINEIFAAEKQRPIRQILSERRKKKKPVPSEAEKEENDSDETKKQGS